MKKTIPVLLLTLIILTVPANPPAQAFYDDVHYSLNYVIARVIGFTPEQAYRIANACVSVDWTPQTEPTQMDAGLAQLWSNKALSAEHLPIASALYGLGAKYQGSPEAWERSLDKVPVALEGLLQQNEFRETFQAQWKFHAFRDLYRFPNAKVDGPPYPTPSEEANAQAADQAIIDQRNLLFEESFELKNLGVFLHFFQDEVPHHGYAIGGGHWVLLPNQWKQSELWEHGANGLPVPEWQQWSQWKDYDKRGAIPSGSTTDWLSYRSLDSNMKMVRETADYMLQFMQRASEGNQKPFVDSPEKVADIVMPLIVKMREVNAAPERLKSMKEVIDTKLLQAGKLSPFGDTPAGASRSYREKMYGKHTGGPSVKAALDVIDPFLNSLGMETIPPISEPPDKSKIFIITRKTQSTGAKIENVDQSVLYGNLRIQIRDFGIASDPEKRPVKIEALLKSVPSQKGEQPSELKRDSADVFSEALNGESPIFEFLNLPMGEADLEVTYTDKKIGKPQTIKQRVKLQNQINTVMLAAESIAEDEEEPVPLDAIVAALKSAGFQTEIKDSHAKDSSGPFADLKDVMGTQDKSRNFPEEPATSVRITAWPKEKYSVEYYSAWTGFPDETETQEFDAGTPDKGWVQYPYIVSYPGGVKYARGETVAQFRCGKLHAFIRHRVESAEGFDPAQSDDESRFEEEEQALRPKAKMEIQILAAKLVNALTSHSACKAPGLQTPRISSPSTNSLPSTPSTPSTPTTGLNSKIEPVIVPPQEPTGGASNTGSGIAPGVTNPGVTVPQVTNPNVPGVTGPQVGSDPAQAQDFFAPAVIESRRNYFLQNASTYSTEIIRSSVAASLSSSFTFQSISDATTADLYAAVSLHIARLNLPVSCFRNYAYANARAWDAHLAWNQERGRENSRQHIVWKADSAFACSSKPMQDALYADISEAIAQAWKGRVIRLPDLPSAIPPANVTPQAVLGTYQQAFQQVASHFAAQNHLADEPDTGDHDYAEEH